MRSNLIGLCFAAMIAAGATAAAHSPPPPDADTDAALSQHGRIPGGSFSLIDHKGRATTDQDFLGKFQLVFFGYTFCPDICPTTLNDIAVTLELLGDDAARIAPLFISVDPDRDTPAVLAEYVGLFHPAIIGLTGSREQVADVVRKYMVHVEKPHDAATADSADDPYYTVDHSAFTYLMAPDGTFRTVFADGEPPEKLVIKIRREIAAWNNEGV